MFEQLKLINQRPLPRSRYTAESLWNDAYTSTQMLHFHLHPDLDMASRRTEFIDRSVDWMVGRLQVDSTTRICDLGCGPGLYTQRFASHGAQVTGVDLSAHSIGYARSQAEEATLNIRCVNENYLEFECAEKFQLITMIMCDFCALSPDQRAKLLRKVHGLLSDDGAFVFDVYTEAAFEKRVEVAEYSNRLLDGFWAEGDYYGFLNTFRYENERVVLDKYSLFAANRQWEVYNWLQYFSLEQLKEEVAEAGFEIEQVYSDVAGSSFDSMSDEMALIARKR